MSMRPCPGMPEETRIAWVKALRSGNYKQTAEALHDKNGYCCLGVLIDACAPEEWAISDSEGGAVRVHTIREDGDYETPAFDWAELPYRLRERFGITSSEADVLMGYNDRGGYDFDEIAQYLLTGEQKKI